MSYDVRFRDSDGNTCVSKVNRQDGGTQVVGGTTDAELNITYNYGKIMYENIEFGLRGLYGKNGKEISEILTPVVEKLGTNTSNDYWSATEGNVGYALSILLDWAREFPEGILEGD